MNADEYNQAELLAGRVTPAMITVLVEVFQRQRVALVLDGKLGPKTREAINVALGAAANRPGSALLPGSLRYPLPTLSDGRRPRITSEFRSSDRPNHDGVDMFYPYREGDSPSFMGDGGATRGADGRPKWVVPYGIQAVAAADGVIQIAGNSPTGFRCWVDHGNGWRTGYFHLLDLVVHAGDKVVQGAPLGLVGHNPKDTDGRHLHFELSPSDRYDPIDPAPYLR